MQEESDSRRKFNAFSNWWLGPDRPAIITRYLEVEASGAQSDDTDATSCIVGLIMAPREVCWEIVTELVRRADDSALDGIAAGPLEGMLGRFGEELIERVECEAARDRRFRRALVGVWQHLMSDEVYARVQRAAR